VPGYHLLHKDHLLLRRGSREDLARPAIHPLFRSAAATFGGQDLAEALVPSMPQGVLRHVEVDHVCQVEDTAQTDMKADDMLGTPSRFTCSECHWALWEIEDGSMLRFRRHVGHAFTADAVLESQGRRNRSAAGNAAWLAPGAGGTGTPDGGAGTRKRPTRAGKSTRDSGTEVQSHVQIVKELLRGAQPGSVTAAAQGKGSIGDYGEE
jgi:hypothetical protein